MRGWYLLPILSIFHLPGPIAAQTVSFFEHGYHIEKFTAQDGLPGTSVKEIVQDQSGFLWLATHGGLVRYDGFDFEVFQPDPNNEGGSYSNFIYKILIDSTGLIWAGTLNEGLYLFDPYQEKFVRHITQNAEQKNSLGDNWIHDLTRIDSQRISVATQNGLSLLYEQGDSLIFNNYYTSLSPLNSPPHQSAVSLPLKAINYGKSFKLPDGNGIWYYNIHGLDELSFEQGRPKFKNVDNITAITKFTAVAPSASGNIWLAGQRQNNEGAWDNVLGLWDQNKQRFQPIVHRIKADVDVRNLYEDPDGNLWVGTWGRGLFLLKDPLNNEGGEHLSFTLATDKAEQKGNVWAIEPDCFGNLWIGTWRGDLYQIHLSTKQVDFRQLKSETGKILKPGHLALDDSGVLWVTAEDGLLFSQSPSGEHHRYQLPVPNAARNVDDRLPLVISESDEIWVGAYDGLIQFNPHTGISRFFNITVRNDSLGKDWINCLFDQGPDALWCGTTHGSIYKFDLQDRTFEAFHEEYSNLGVINDLLVTSEGFLMASTSRGLHKIDTGDASDKQEISINGGALDLCEAEDGRLWLSSYLGGFYEIDKVTSQPRQVYRRSGALDLSWTTGILEDHGGSLWISTPRGFIKFDPDQAQFEVFSQLSAFTNPNTASVVGKCKGADGKLFFATRLGILGFTPRQIKKGQALPKIVIKSITVNGQALQHSNGSLSRTANPYLSELKLPFRQNDIAIEYAGLQFDDPASITYQYQLEGLHDDWVMVGKERVARFPDLPPGSYTFQLKAANSDGRWTSLSSPLQIQVLSPWWKTWWSYLLYGILATGLIIWAYRFQLNRKLMEAESKRLKEMDQLKTRLYTNITHEFRTPLTVIQGMTEQAKKYFQDGSQSQFDVTTDSIQRNTKRLLHLINQMLDLSKLEVGALSLEPIQADIIHYLEYIISSFDSFAQSKNIQLILYKEQDHLMMDFDPDKLMVVVSNLLSNAIKFTPPEGKIIFHIREEKGSEHSSLLLRVQDNGIGISQARIPYIFNRFYQVDNSTTRKEEGTGIGLALSKELVELMGGKIFVESEPNKGTTFTVQFPITAEAPIEALSLHELSPLAERTAAKYTPATNNGQLDLPTILIVEDNADVSLFLKFSLQDRYNISLAENGQEGIKRALEEVPDLIISDVMMPEKNGFELCRTLKNNEKTSHIPIILLTAKADDESKIAGLEKGADAYLAKPFNERELMVRIRKMLELRKKMQARYQTVMPIPVNGHGHYPKEDAFVKKIQAILEIHLSDEDFGVLQLAHQLGMSRSQVFKKIKALTGKSIAQYIRLYRLQRSYHLLESTDLSVSEIAYSVGFKDPAYFSRVFSEQFGQAPRTTRK